MDLYKYFHPELITWLKVNRTELGYALASGSMAILRCVYRGESFKNTCTEGIMCAMAAFGISEVLIAFDWDPGLAFPASVFIGYVGLASALRIFRLKGRPDDSGKK